MVVFQNGTCCGRVMRLWISCVFILDRSTWPIAQQAFRGEIKTMMHMTKRSIYLACGLLFSAASVILSVWGGC